MVSISPPNYPYAPKNYSNSGGYYRNFSTYAAFVLLRALPQIATRSNRASPASLSINVFPSLFIPLWIKWVGVRKFHALPPASASAYFKRSWLWEEGLIRALGLPHLFLNQFPLLHIHGSQQLCKSIEKAAEEKAGVHRLRQAE
ncbi:hypothetical protein SDJN02_15847, partial [Cucurbita argyrosperma subsp. argyrosperma]